MVTIVIEKAPTGLAEALGAVFGVDTRSALAARRAVTVLIHKVVGAAGGSGSCSRAEAAHTPRSAGMAWHGIPIREWLPFGAQYARPSSCQSTG
jgi:hypothetical protein